MTFIGTVGMIHVDRDKLISMPADILKRPLERNDVRLPRAKSHHDDWLDCVRSRKDPIANVEVGARSVTVCHLGNLAYWYRRPMFWDSDLWELGEEAEAGVYGPGVTAATNTNRQPIPLDRERRDPWKLPEV